MDVKEAFFSNQGFNKAESKRAANATPMKAISSCQHILLRALYSSLTVSFFKQLGTVNGTVKWYKISPGKSTCNMVLDLSIL